MKVRSCFVSNSSTSSFIMIGTQLTNVELKKIYPNGDDIYLKLEEDGYFFNHDNDIFGIMLSCWSDTNECGEAGYDIETLEGFKKNVMDKTGKEDVKLYFGTLNT